MGAVDLAFMDLRPVAGNTYLDDRNLRIFRRRKSRRVEFWDFPLFAEPGPDEAPPFPHWIGAMLDLVQERATFGFG